MTVSAFHVSKEQWATRKDLNFTVEFKFHPDLVLQPVSTAGRKVKPDEMAHLARLSPGPCP